MPEKISYEYRPPFSATFKVWRPPLGHAYVLFNEDGHRSLSALQYGFAQTSACSQKCGDVADAKDEPSTMAD